MLGCWLSLMWPERRWTPRPQPPRLPRQLEGRGAPEIQVLAREPRAFRRLPVLFVRGQPGFMGQCPSIRERVGRDAGWIAEEVIAHLTGIVGAEVRVTLEIDARIAGGVSEAVERTVMENGRTLKFEGQEFERE